MAAVVEEVRLVVTYQDPYRSTAFPYFREISLPFAPYSIHQCVRSLIQNRGLRLGWCCRRKAEDEKRREQQTETIHSANNSRIGIP
jgi:hypothetical protein